MSIRTVVAVAFLALGSLACAGMMPTPDPLSYMPEAQLVEPWTKMSLPIEGGKVTMCDDTMVTVMYSGSKVDEKLNGYSGSIEKVGFKKEMDVSGDPSTKSVIFGKGDNKKLTLTVTTAADLTTVSLMKTGG